MNPTDFSTTFFGRPMALSAKGKTFQSALPGLRKAWAQGHFEAYVAIFATQRGLQLGAMSFRASKEANRSPLDEEWEAERPMGAAVWVVPKGVFAAIASIGSRFDFFSDEECRKATHAALGPSGMGLSGSAYSIDAFDKNAWGFALHVTTCSINADRQQPLAPGAFARVIAQGALAHAQGACSQMRNDLLKEGLSAEDAAFASGFAQPLPAALGPILSRQENPYGASALPPNEEGLIASGIREALAREETGVLKKSVEAVSAASEGGFARPAPRL